MRRRGFTTVELLVSIAILVILAGVVGFALNGWRSSVAATEVKNDLQSAAAKLKDYRTWNNAYPATLAEVFTPSGKVTVVYVPSGADYCLRGTSTARPSVRYYINSSVSLQPTTTSC